MNARILRWAALPSAVLALLAAGCGGDDSTGPGDSGSSSPPKGLKVGYSAPSFIDTLQKTWADEVCKQVKAAGGQCIQTDAQNNASKQISDVEDLLARNVDYLVVNPTDEKAIVPAIEMANQQHVPVFTVDNSAAGGDIVTKVKFDNYKAGKDSADFCAKQMGDKGEVAELQGKAGSDNVRQRHQGFVDGLKDHPGLKLVASRYTDWDTNKSLAITEDILSSHPGVKCIWSHADAIIVGAAQAVKKARRHDVTTIGMGMYGGGPEAIAAGDVTASWYLAPENVGKEAGKALIAYSKDKKAPKQINTAIEFVTKENVKEYPGSNG